MLFAGSCRQPNLQRNSSLIIRRKAGKFSKATAKELDDELNARAWKDTLPRFALRPEALDEGRYSRFESFLREAGLLDGYSSCIETGD
jgi:hypothetical protein